MQDIERQLSALNELKGFLISFMGDLTAKTQEYNRRVHGLRDAGLPVQISDNYEANYCNPNNQHLRHLIENMENVDLQFINANIAHFEQALERARMMR